MGQFARAERQPGEDAVSRGIRSRAERRMLGVMEQELMMRLGARRWLERRHGPQAKAAVPSFLDRPIIATRHGETPEPTTLPTAP